MSEEKHKRQNRNSLFRLYLIRLSVFLGIALAVTALATLVVKGYATRFVHKAETAYSMRVDDITPDPSFEPDSLSEIPEGYRLGKKVAVITSEAVGLNSSVYYGADRSSMRYGCGLSSQYTLFGQDGVSYVTGYSEADFAPVLKMKVGDKISVATEYGTVNYTVTDSYSGENKKLDFSNYKGDTLILSSLYPMLSNDWGKAFIVVARADGEVQ